jgi:hypothetical protein
MASLAKFFRYGVIPRFVGRAGPRMAATASVRGKFMRKRPYQWKPYTRVMASFAIVLRNGMYRNFFIDAVTTGANASGGIHRTVIEHPNLPAGGFMAVDAILSGHNMVGRFIIIVATNAQATGV